MSIIFFVLISAVKNSKNQKSNNNKKMYYFVLTCFRLSCRSRYKLLQKATNFTACSLNDFSYCQCFIIFFTIITIIIGTSKTFYFTKEMSRVSLNWSVNCNKSGTFTSHYKNCSIDGMDCSQTLF